MTAIEETTMETTARHMLNAEHTPIFAELAASLGDPTTFREKAEQEYNEERNRPKPTPPAGKKGVKRS